MVKTVIVLHSESVVVKTPTVRHSQSVVVKTLTVSARVLLGHQRVSDFITHRQHQQQNTHSVT